MLRVLIIGVDGAIGSALAEALTERDHQVWGTTRRDRSSGPSERIRLDLATGDLSKVALPRVDVAIVCAAMARFADCRSQPELARQVNVTAPALLAERLTNDGTRVVLLSTSAVFDGRTPHVSAETAYAPLSAYGRLKAEAESRIRALGAPAGVLRLSKVIAPATPLVAEWVARLSAGKPIDAFQDLTLAPITLADAVHAATAAIEDERGGIYQASGAQDIAYLDLAMQLVRDLGSPAELVRAASAAEQGIPEEEMLRYTSLDSGRLTARTGWKPPGISTVVRSVLDHWRHMPVNDGTAVSR